MPCFIAFRCFGRFQWPPLPRKLGDEPAREGVVEIHYRKDKGSWIGYLRWLPKDLLTGAADKLTSFHLSWDHEAASDAAKVYELTPKALAERFSPLSTPVVLRFDKVPGKGVGPRLRFEGITALDQFSIPDPLPTDADPAPKPNLRIPLVPEISRKTNGRTHTWRSALQIGNGGENDGSDDLRIEPIVPLPLPVNEEQRGDSLAYFAFSALYSATRKRLDKHAALGLSFQYMTFGLRGADTEAEKPARSVLGNLGWAPRFSQEAAAREDALVAADRLDFWPDAPYTIAQVLEHFGHRAVFIADPKLGQHFTAETQLADTRGLKRFPGLGVEAVSAIGGAAPGFCIRQRFAAEVASSQTTVRTDPAASRFRCVDGDIRLPVPGSDGAWLSFGKRIYLEAALTGVIADEDVWAPPLANSTLRLNIGSEQDLALVSTAAGNELPAYRSDPTPSLLTLPEVLARTIAAMRMTLASRRQLNPARPSSLLPELTLVSRKAAHFGLFAHGPVRGSGDWGQPVHVRQPPSFRASLQGDDIFTAPGGGPVLRFKARWPAFDLEGRQGDPVDLRAVHAAPGTGNDARFFALQLLDDDPAQAKQREAILDGMVFRWHGALLTRAPGKAAVAGSASLLHIGWPSRVPAWKKPGDELASMLPRSGGHFKLHLDMSPNECVQVSGELATGDRSGRQATLLLRDGAGTGGASAQWRLVVDESVSDNLPSFAPAPWQMSAQLIDRSGGSAGASTSSTVLFSFTPFSVLRYHALPLEERGNEGNAIAARYDSDTGAWTTLRTSPFYHYTFAPQSVGESMDKPSRLELHDLLADPSEGKFARPYPAAATGGGAAAAEDERLAQRHLVDFRLTPPADLWIRPADVDRNYLLPEWASRQIFSQVAQGGVGAALAAFRGEFVYGLAVGLWPKAERGPSRRARVAEIEALTGTLLEKSPKNDDKARRWNRIHDAYQRRPERLEIWADDPDNGLPFAPARFEHGARFALRTTALHRAPVLPAPDIAALPADPFAAPTQRAPQRSPRLHPQGLAGGALWPIESLNVLNLVLDMPTASSGHIDSIAIGPLGGDADQTARFGNDRVSIITETRNGHVQRQRVEVIGRIAVWWHRAKHVVIYERTVNPSAQFAPERGGETRTRRPVLRKVREFIELLQPERRYPDVAGASPATNSFVQGMRFNTTIIPVDSFWGEDVDTRGWKVPLWNRHAARQRPQVYGMPDIVFLQAGEGAAGDTVTGQQCLNPENLYFFTNTGQGSEITADTDRWPNERSIDWINLPPPQSSLAVADEDEDDPEDVAWRAREPAVPPGFARFTWRLAPAARRTAINHARGDRPVYAALRTLTFMRAGRLENADPPKPALPRSALTPLAAVSERWQPGKVLDQGPESFKALSAAMRDFHLPDAPPEGDSLAAAMKTIQGLRERVDALGDAATAAALQQQLGSLKQRSDSVDKELAKRLGMDAGSVRSLLKGNPCDDWKRSITGAIGAKRRGIDQELQAWETRFAREVDRWVAAPQTAPLANREALLEYLKENIKAALGPLFEATSVGIGKADEGCEAARCAVRDARANLDRLLVHARHDLQAITGAIDRDKPWSEQRLDDLCQQFDDAFAKAQADLRGELQDVCERLTAELDDVSRGVGTAAARALRELGAGVKGVKAWTGSGRTALMTVYLPLLSKLAAALRGEHGAPGRLAQLRQAIDERADSLPEGVAKSLREGISGIEAALTQAEAALGALVPTLDRLSQEADKATAASAAALRASLDEAKKSIDELLETARQSLGAGFKDLQELLEGALAEGQFATNAMMDHFLEWAESKDPWIDAVAQWVEKRLAALIDDVAAGLGQVSSEMEGLITDLTGALSDLRLKLDPDQVTSAIAAALLRAIEDPLDRLGIEFPVVTADSLAEVRDPLLRLAAEWREGASKALEVPAGLVSELLKDLDKACEVFQGAADRIGQQLEEGAQNLLEGVVGKIKKTEFYRGLEKFEQIAQDAAAYAELLDKFSRFGQDVCKLGNQLTQSAELATAYADRAIKAIADIGSGGLLATPNNILRAMASLGSPPSMQPALDYAERQIGYYHGLVDQLVDTTEAKAYLGRLGDSLKAWGLALPFKGIGDHLLPKDLGNYDIGQIFRNCGGLQLERLFKGCRLPKGVGDAVRLSHEFNQEAFRAWVQLDVDAAFPERQALLSLGPFSLNAVNTRLVGRMRLEASKDTERVEDEGEATLNTDFESVVGGQVMVTLRSVAVSFSKGGGLKVDFDPKKIEINQSLQFVQNALGSIFGDEMGGMQVIKRDGVPVGLEHLFRLPPVSLMFGTSGLQNIQISNQFQLIAYPDFRIANRFSLARPELPFIFSIFIIGGTGWLTVDVDYRPFGGELVVVVDAAAGGSASLGFAFAGCTGAVAITLAAALGYRKLIGNSGGGLTVSMVVSIVGVVDVLRIASAHLSIVLQLSYAENGDIDASGTFKLEVRITRFFKAEAAGDARYRMAGGQRTSQSGLSAGVGLTGEADKTTKAVNDARNKAGELLKAQGSLDHA